MPKRKCHVPSYRLHKPSGQARVIINREHIYLGPYGSPESREKYARYIAEMSVSDQTPPQAASTEGKRQNLSIGDVIVAYWPFAESYYVKDGKPSDELSSMRAALRPLRDLYASTLANEFGPKSLKAVREQMVKEDMCRNVVNHNLSRIKRFFRWAVGEELVDPSVYHGLQAVPGLRAGKTEARETEPIKPVPDEHVDAVLPFVSPHVSAMIQVERLTGMRPCEVVIMRACDIDMSGEVWVYEPPDHKNRWRGKRRLIPVGPKAQVILKPFLDRDPAAYFFSPKEGDAWRNEQRRLTAGTDRKTPVYPSELRSKEKAKQARKRRKPIRPRRDHYDTHSYQKAIEYGFARAEKAGVEIPHWSPNQLRHNRGTEVRKVYGVEAAQVILGHARADVTQIYAEKNQELAMRIAKETG
jgi:integrase